MLLDIGLIAGERRMCWSGEWDHWEYLEVQVTENLEETKAGRTFINN